MPAKAWRSAFAAGDALPCFDRILAAEAEARSAHRGFWSRNRCREATPEALQPRIGRFAIFEGTVVSVGTRPATDLSRLRQDMVEGRDDRDRRRRTRDAFGGEAALDKLAGARIRARGFLEENAGPMLTVRSPMQLEILATGSRRRQDCALILRPNLRICGDMLRNVLAALAGVLLAGCQLTGSGAPSRVEPVAVVAPRTPSAAEEAIGERENPRVVAEYGGVY